MNKKSSEFLKALTESNTKNEQTQIHLDHPTDTCFKVKRLYEDNLESEPLPDQVTQIRQADIDDIAEILNKPLPTYKEWIQCSPDVEFTSRHNPYIKPKPKTGKGTKSLEDMKIDKNDFQDVLQIEISSEKTLVTAVIIDPINMSNGIRHIPCYHGQPYGGYTYDMKNDTYVISCVDFRELGIVNFSLYVSLPCLDWRIPIPIPRKVLEKYLKPIQRRSVYELKKAHPSNFNLQYLQIRSCDQ